MSAAVVLFVMAGGLIGLGAVLREREVPAAGGIGRRKISWVITAGIVVCALGAAALTLERLIVMAQ